MSLETERLLTGLARSFMGDGLVRRVSYDDVLDLVRQAFEAGESHAVKETLPTAF